MISGLILIDAHSSNPFTKQCISGYFIKKTDKFINSPVNQKLG